ncbi:2-aminoethylphosphonate--pyruvate transaminase [Limnobacter sp.]|uniref:2-aminoethylphosphonate--pyruvate transaminase n=1 Tax=Limnobacter sp. TaxID=2003368 RepID=UPI00258605E2|nr:2-aminoethylphosphonate--pyruvate transaminase [Limnobacter sp.]
MSHPYLLTPGPLTTSARTKAAMLDDWGSWDKAFNQLTASICHDLLKISNASSRHVCVPLQGSGTFAVEAALGTLTFPESVVLVPVNGAYSQRIVTILQRLKRRYVVVQGPEKSPISFDVISQILDENPLITHLAIVHCETGTGVLNPLQSITELARGRGVEVIVDAMSSFGALPIDLSQLDLLALISASGKCLEGVPGMGFVITREESLLAARGNSSSLALDLTDQWTYLQKTGQWRFTPPTHVVAALAEALNQYWAEGGQPARHSRYSEMCTRLVRKMSDLGIHSYLAPEYQAPIIVTFLAPPSPAYSFQRLYKIVRQRGYILYPGKLTEIETFRIGCIGAIDGAVIDGAVSAVQHALQEMGVL